MGLNPKHLLELVVRPALDQFPAQYQGISAERILMMIAAHESAGFVHLRQITGPALGLWQMEPETFRWLRDLAFSGDNPKKVGVRRALAAFSSRAPTERDLAGNLLLAAAYARARLIPVKGALPDKDDIPGLALYAKMGYNTSLGKARPEDYETAFRRYVERLDLWRGRS